MIKHTQILYETFAYVLRKHGDDEKVTLIRDERKSSQNFFLKHLFNLQ
jgi:hypothetical protein